MLRFLNALTGSSPKDSEENSNRSSGCCCNIISIMLLNTQNSIRMPGIT